MPQSWEAPVNPALAKGNAEPALVSGLLTFSGVAAFLRRNVRKIGTLALFLFMAGIIILLIVPTRYAATALVLVDPRELRVTTDPDVLPGIGQDAAALQSLIEVAKSDGFLRPLIEKLKIAEDDDIARGEQNTSKLLDKFRARLDISRRGLTYVIAMTFSSSSPERSAYYANAVAEAFVANQNQTHTKASEEAASWLNDRLKTLNDQVRAADDAVAAFKAEHKIINAGKESTTRQLRVTELSQQVSAARLLTEEARNRYEQAQRNLKANIEGTPTNSRADLLSLLRAQRTQLNDQIAQKRAVLGDRHPDLVIAYNQLNELNKQIETERRRNIDSAKSDYETLLDQQKALERQLASLEGEMAADVQASVKLQELQRNADASRNIYEQFLQRYKVTSEQSSLPTSQVQIASRATTPTHPTRPALALILAALAIAAPLCACAIVAMVEQAQSGATTALDAQVRSVGPAENREATNIPVWGRIPNLAVSLADKLGWRRPTEPGADVDVRGYLQGLLDEIAVAPSGRGKVVLVTSAEPRAGKSAVARSLNAAAIDRGMLSVLIHVVPEMNAGPNERERVLRTTAHSLKVLLGDHDGNAQASADAGDVRSDFDLIVIDGPTFGQRDDVGAIATCCEVTVLVIAAGAASASIVTRAKAALSRSGNTRLGAIINNPRPASQLREQAGGWYSDKSKSVA